MAGSMGPISPAEEAATSGRSRGGPSMHRARISAWRPERDLAGALLERCEFPPAAGVAVSSGVSRVSRVSGAAGVTGASGATGPAGASSGRPAVLAVSGGADSLALLVLASRAGLDVLAVHVDHGLRPGSNREAALVAAAAAAYGAAFEARSVTVPPGPDLEGRARQAR